MKKISSELCVTVDDEDNIILYTPVPDNPEQRDPYGSYLVIDQADLSDVWDFATDGECQICRTEVREGELICCRCLAEAMRYHLHTCGCLRGYEQYPK
jgi:hypothetical protein